RAVLATSAGPPASRRRASILAAVVFPVTWRAGYAVHIQAVDAVGAHESVARPRFLPAGERRRIGHVPPPPQARFPTGATAPGVLSHPSHADRCLRRLTMTFMHKLSRRLALMRNVLLLGGLVTLSGCDLRKLMGLLEGVVVTVSVDPAASNIAAGRTVQLTATPRDGSGNALTGRVVTWATDNAAVATVNASGLVTGGAAGAANVTA